MKVKIEVSARHTHLSKDDLEVLFGEGYQLKSFRKLSQEDEFAAEETVDLKYGDKVIKGVRIIGPLRDKTQVEISRTDCFFFKLNAPLRLSGDLEDSAGITMIGPKGEIELKEGVIVAKRHLHCSTKEAQENEFKEGDVISVEIGGERSLVFNNVIIRIDDQYSLAVHIDTDEGNSAGIYNIGEGEILK